MQTRTRLLRFGLVGAINTSVDVAVYGGLRSLGPGIVTANLLSTSCGLLVSLLLNSRFTFNDGRLTKRGIVGYFAITLSGLWLLQPAVIILMTKLDRRMHLGASLAGTFGHQAIMTNLLPKLAATVVTMTWNYVWYAKLYKNGGST